MVILEYADATPGTKDRRRKAGMKAEEQMAHYLGRAFGASPDVMLLHGLRLVDASQQEPGGGPCVAQMDHLVLHRHGAFIVESKSCSGSVRISKSGSGRDEWAIKPRGFRQFQGIPSPLQQASRQSQILARTLIRHRAELRGKAMLGLMQKGFKHMPLQVVVSISDNGEILPRNRWKAPQEPFRWAVEKSDNVPGFIAQEIEHHLKNGRLIGSDEKDPYGRWSLDSEEMERVTRLLVSMHTPLHPVRVATTPQDTPPPRGVRESTSRFEVKAIGFAACRECGETQRLDGRPGRYGPYWHCGVCEANTTMPRRCSACGANDASVVAVRKKGNEFVRDCTACGVGEVVWRLPEGG